MDFIYNSVNFFNSDVVKWVTAHVVTGYSFKLFRDSFLTFVGSLRLLSLFSNRAENAAARESYGPDEPERGFHYADQAESSE